MAADGEKQNVLLDGGRQVQQNHDLGDASGRDVAQSRQLRIIPDRPLLEPAIKFVSKRQKQTCR